MIEIVENTKDLPETLAAEGEVRLRCAVLCCAEQGGSQWAQCVGVPGKQPWALP